MNAVVLDLVSTGEPTDYCVHGRATCAGCGAWLWLGPETYGPVAARTILPACRGCVQASGRARAENLVGRLEDRSAH